MVQAVHEKTVMKKAQPIFKAVVQATYKENFAFRSNMAVSLITQPVYFLVQYFIWQAVFTAHETVSGYTLDTMLYYFAVSSLLGFLNWDSADGTLQRLVQTGKFITFQLRPVSHLYYAFFEKVGHRILAFWVEMVPILGFYLLFGIKPIPAKPFWAIVSVALSFILGFLINYTIGTIAFWLVKTDGVRRAVLVFKDICSGIFLPLTLFPSDIQRVLFVLPFQFVSYVPARVFMGSYELAGITMSIPQVVGLQAVMVAVTFLLNRLIWFFGIKRFTGVGA
jgi:ABC-2 type transport system permease protein